MFSNIGKKIKGLAQVLCWLIIILCVIAGVPYIATGEILLGLAIVVGGFLAGWVGSFVLYGFGELVDNSTIQTRLLLQKEKQN